MLKANHEHTDFGLDWSKRRWTRQPQHAIAWNAKDSCVWASKVVERYGLAMEPECNAVSRVGLTSDNAVLMGPRAQVGTWSAKIDIHGESLIQI